MVDKLEALDYAEAARVMLQASGDRFMRVQQCYPAIDALTQAGFISAPTSANGDQVERVKEVAHRIVCEFRPTGWPAKEDEIARLLMLTFPTPTEDARERVKVLEEALRGMVDLYDADEGCRSLPQTVNALTVLGNKETDRHG